MPNYEYYRELLQEAEDYIECSLSSSTPIASGIITELSTALRELIPPIQRVE